MTTSDDLLNQAISIYLSALKNLGHFVSQPASRYSLSFEQYLILQEIVTKPGIKLMDIAHQRRVTRSAVSRQLRVLLNNNYVRQEQVQADRRKVALVPTAMGERVATNVQTRIRQRFAKWVDIYGEARGQKLLQLLDEFNQQVIQPENDQPRKDKENND
ncbi:MarR family winged helix-turn-helix transcriptional regulator [Limosilactobacillus sp.]|jgi:DNA-binding MarR family transcriptional regulator|uniref:MarR family winged helix-turn-helix transcriptional regulator n=1 Tax=Limosilactobacillus sp. TaxID=2773925 RepID=UPI00359FF684